MADDNDITYKKSKNDTRYEKIPDSARLTATDAAARPRARSCVGVQQSLVMVIVMMVTVMVMVMVMVIW